MILLDGIVVGLVASLVTGGRLQYASQNPVRLELLLLIGLTLQLTWPRVAAALGVTGTEFLVVWALVAVLVLGVAIVNIRVPGMALVAAGLLLNLLVIVLNGGMPVSLTDVAATSEGVARLVSVSPLHVVLDDSTRASFLADIIYVPGPSWHRSVVSIGDVLMATGVGMVAFWSLRRREDEPGSAVV